MLDQRRSEILRALVEEHIHTGEAVSSRAVLERSGLQCSSATVRNQLVVLEGEGYVAQPHTSAGRIPTPVGYRYYIDHLSPGPLRSSTRTKIEGFFSSMHAELGRVLKQTSELLAEITHYPAAVVGPGVAGDTLRDIHLVQVDPNVVLLVLVTEGGRVSQRMTRLGEPRTPEEVAAAERVLREALDDTVLSAERSLVDDAVLGGLSPQVAEIVEGVLLAVDRAAAAGRELYLGGTSMMVSLWEDLAKLHRILILLDQQATLMTMLGESSEGTTVRLGSELAVAEQDMDLAVVSTPYVAGGQGSGRMGVFGPMRMDYRRAIKIVEEVSDALGGSLGS
ncbi:MAG: heat-inducible transcriptional repressor HrcA [Acidimicrobiia bacterium]